jgi:uncharacterized membrane protein
VTSYLYVGVVWLNHKAAFNRIQFMDRGLHWANLGILFTTALLPFPTAVMSQAIEEGNPADARASVALYALVGALLCASWLAFFHYLHRHPELVDDRVDDRFFRGERLRALVGVVAYPAAGVLGWLITPLVASAIFLALPVFYGLTSHGYTEVPSLVRRRR